MGEKILFVDDEVPVVQGYRRILHREFDVSAANSGGEGLEAIRNTGPYAVVISDMRMPGMNGAQFLAKARELAPDTMRILLTGYSDMDAAIEAVNMGNIFRYLTKPCEKEVLMEAIESAISVYRATNANKETVKNAQLIAKSSLDWGSKGIAPEQEGMRLDGLPGEKEAREFLEPLFKAPCKGYVVLIKLTILGMIEDRYGIEAAADYIRCTARYLMRGLPAKDELFQWRSDLLMIVVGRPLSPAAMRMEISRLMQDRREMITQASGKQIMVSSPTIFDLTPISGFSNSDEIFTAFDAKMTRTT